jgi:hypothetical protein
MKNQEKQNNTAIVALICSAVALLAAVLFVQPSTSYAEESIKDRDFQMVTARVTGGSDALYIVENRTGMMAIFLYEPGRGVVLKGRESIAGAR